MQSITVLGSTGSIGVNTLDVIARHPDRYSVFALTANNRTDIFLEQCKQLSPRYAVLADESLAGKFAADIRNAGLNVEVLTGVAGLEFVASHADVDTVMAAIVGFAGLAPTLAAVKAGKKILLANKEALVCAGHVFMQAVRESGAQLLPIDSEHNAIFQCLAHGKSLADAGVRRLLLTASGGPFRDLSLEKMHKVTPEQACAHPNWSMGRKISVDSATMMNKGLELIEACWLFGASPGQIDIVVHPQSIVHSLVEYIDGSTLAQLGNPDMRTPIAYGLAWPERIDAGVPRLDLVAAGRLDFLSPDEIRFPSLRLAREAFLSGGSAPVVLNAANEIAVAAFLVGNLSFTGVANVVERVLERMAGSSVPEDLLALAAVDSESRQMAEQEIQRRA
ncbi:MAG TPA: 1-deoxy-D-xylulose-5-phosphate reductoisomerase [Pseudomonadales bacterium]|nr:1-deoxy-D-xylulose-5-phosphate reductoisomerase [Pseudomonadales bacterium]